MNIVPTLIPVSDLQRDSARIVNLAKLSDQPIIIIRNNKPEVAMLNIKKLQLMTDKIKDFEEKQLLWELKETENEFKAGKTYFTKDFSELLDD
jgi:PHD/YefM family antitoxin component YafN of YafNO toxin-antitoxin module